MSRFTKERQAEITAKRLATRAARSAAKEKKGKVRRGKKTSSHSPSFHAAFLFGRISTEIEFYASSQGIPVSELTSELAALFRHHAGG